MPAIARWALKVFDGILALELPLRHPAVMAQVSKGALNPTPRKQAPPLPIELLQALGRVTGDKAIPFGFRLYASLYILMALASLRFSDTRVVFHVWVTETAFCGRSRDLKRKGRPIIAWASPIAGLNNNPTWARNIMRSWNNDHPAHPAHRSLYPSVAEQWKVGRASADSFSLALRMFRGICVKLGVENPKWALRTASAWPPPCANQLGWSEEERRKHGHWATGSAMVGHNDRACCTAGMRLRDRILAQIRDDSGAPTDAFQVPTRPSQQHKGVKCEPTTPVLKQGDAKPIDIGADTASETSVGADAEKSEREDVDIF